MPTEPPASLYDLWVRLFTTPSLIALYGMVKCSSRSRVCGRLPEDTGTDVPLILEKFGLQKDGILNNAAAVLFGKHDGMEYPQCTLRLARFKGTDKTVFMDSQRIQGNFFQLLNALGLHSFRIPVGRKSSWVFDFHAVIINGYAHRTASRPSIRFSENIE